MNTTGGLNAAATDSYGYIIITPASGQKSSFARFNLTSGVADQLAGLNQDAVGLALQAADVPAVVLTTGGTQGRLVRFYAKANATPATAGQPGMPVTVDVSGVRGSETLVAIDYRPATGQLIGLGIDGSAETGTLYIVDPDGGAVEPIGGQSSIVLYDAAATPAVVDLPADGWSIDVNSAVDKVRVVNANGINFRVDPTNGTIVDSNSTATSAQGDTSLTGLSGTGNALGASGVAYTNAWGGAGATTLYILDSTGDKLCRFAADPNAGVASDCHNVVSGTPAVAFDVPAGADIDFAGDVRVNAGNEAATGLVWAALNRSGQARLYTIDVTSGVATEVAQIGTGVTVLSIAVGHNNIR